MFIRLRFLQELEKTLADCFLSGYSDEERRVLKRMCKGILADIDEWERRKKREKAGGRRKEKGIDRG